MNWKAEMSAEEKFGLNVLKDMSTGRKGVVIICCLNLRRSTSLQVLIRNVFTIQNYVVAVCLVVVVGCRCERSCEVHCPSSCSYVSRDFQREM